MKSRGLSFPSIGDQGRAHLHAGRVNTFQRWSLFASDAYSVTERIWQIVGGQHVSNESRMSELRYSDLSVGNERG